MIERRRRRIVRRAVMVMCVLVVGLAGIFLAMHDPPEIQRSRALRLGMTVPEVRAVMGGENGAEVLKGGDTPILIVHYGRSKYKLKGIRSQMGYPKSGIKWPVRVHYGRGPQGWCVIRIERGDEVEESPQ